MQRAADEFKVASITTLSKKPDASRAKALLEQACRQVQPIMRKRQWVVPLVSEFYPKSAGLLGLNVGGGGGRTKEIRIRLRQAGDDSTFYPYEHVLGTLLHELTHNIHGPHNASFYKLLEEITQECEDLMDRGISGSGEGFDAPSAGRLGSHSFIPTHNPPPERSREAILKAAEQRARAQSVMPAGPQKVGGDARRMHNMRPGEAAAAAAERRAADNLWCPNELLQDRGGDADIDQRVHDIEESTNNNIPPKSRLPQGNHTQHPSAPPRQPFPPSSTAPKLSTSSHPPPSSASNPPPPHRSIPTTSNMHHTPHTGPSALPPGHAVRAAGIPSKPQPTAALRGGQRAVDQHTVDQHAVDQRHVDRRQPGALAGSSGTRISGPAGSSGARISGLAGSHPSQVGRSEAVVVDLTLSDSEEEESGREAAGRRALPQHPLPSKRPRIPIQWSCPCCTLFNAPEALMCDACEQPGPSQAAGQPTTASSQQQQGPKGQQQQQQQGQQQQQQQGQQERQRQRTWTCSVCTCENEEREANCLACSTWRFSRGPPITVQPASGQWD